VGSQGREMDMLKVKTQLDKKLGSGRFCVLVFLVRIRYIVDTRRAEVLNRP
jgi:hypothetical protein